YSIFFSTRPGPPAPYPRSDHSMPAIGTDRLRFAHRRAGGKEAYFFTEAFRGLRPRTLGYFLYGQKVTKKPHRGGTLSMGSLPYEPHPHDDTKGGTRPPL